MNKNDMITYRSILRRQHQIKNQYRKIDYKIAILKEKQINLFQELYSLVNQMDAFHHFKGSKYN